MSTLQHVEFILLGFLVATCGELRYVLNDVDDEL
jgi:hypothetical protein